MCAHIEMCPFHIGTAYEGIGISTSQHECIIIYRMLVYDYIYDDISGRIIAFVVYHHHCDDVEKKG